MANVKLSYGGTSIINHHQCAGSPQLTEAPYGHRALTPASPHFDAHADEILAKPTYVLSYPLRPSVLEVQRNNIKVGNPKAGDSVYLVYVPVNHFLEAIRLDVSVADSIMVGATIEPVGALEKWNPVTKQFDVAELPEVKAAATAQGVTPIPIDVPSSTVFFLTKVTDDYAVPLYVAPVLNKLTGAAGDTLYEWHQSGALHLGFKIVTMPTDTTVTLDQMRGAIHFVALARKFDCQTTV